MKFKLGDLFAVVFFVAFTCLVFFFPWYYGKDPAGLSLTNKIRWDGWVGFTLDGLKNFGSVVKQYPYISGFLKVGLLATFGEMIKTRGRTGSWKTPDLVLKFLVWGVYGMLFTIAFAIFGFGMESIMGTGEPPLCLEHNPLAIWPFKFENAKMMHIWQGFSTSLWTNLIFCFPMMLSHDYWNTCISKKRFLGGTEYLEGIDKHLWGSYLPKTIVFFWIPAHTITFSLPKDFQVLMSAYLSLALGFLLTIKPKKKAD